MTSVSRYYIDHEPETETDSPETILKKIRIKNMNRLVIGTLNINSLASKFDQLKEIIGTHRYFNNPRNKA